MTQGGCPAPLILFPSHRNRGYVVVPLNKISAWGGGAYFCLSLLGAGDYVACVFPLSKYFCTFAFYRIILLHFPPRNQAFVISIYPCPRLIFVIIVYFMCGVHAVAALYVRKNCEGVPMGAEAVAVVHPWIQQIIFVKEESRK